MGQEIAGLFSEILILLLTKTFTEIWYLKVYNLTLHGNANRPTGNETNRPICYK